MLNNPDPKRTIRTQSRTHVASSMRRLSSIGMFSNPMYLRFDEPETVTKEVANQMVTDAVTAAKAEGGKGWYDNMSEELRNHPTMQKFKTTGIDDVGNSYIRLQSLINEKGVIIPKDGADEQTIKDYHKAIGVPEKVTGYVPAKIEGLHDGAKSGEASLKAFQENALKMGLTPRQFAGIHEMYLRDVSPKLTAWDEQQTKEFNVASTALRAEWAGNYESKQAIAAKIIVKYGGDELLNFFKEKGIGNDPRILKVFADIGDHLSEDSLGKLGISGLTMTKAEAQAKINEMRVDQKSAFNDDQNPGHDEAVEYMASLYKITSGTT